MESKNNIECDVDCSGYNIVGCEWVEATQSCDTLTFTPEPEPDVDDNNTAYTITTLSDATTTTLPTQLTPIPPQPGFLGLDITQWTTLFYTLTIIIVFIVAAVAAFIFATRNN